MYTQFQYLCNFCLLLISISSSTLLYVINVPQYHWQLHTYKAHVQKLCTFNLKSYDHTLNHATINTVFSEMEYCLQQQQTVNLYPTGGYLNFSTCFMKNVLLEQKMIKQWNKWHFLKNKTDIMQHDLKCSKYPSVLNI